MKKVVAVLTAVLVSACGGGGEEEREARSDHASSTPSQARRLETVAARANGCTAGTNSTACLPQASLESPQWPTESQALTQRIPVPNVGPKATLSLFASGNAYLSLDGRNLGGPTRSENADSHTEKVLDVSDAYSRIKTIAPAGGGVVVLYEGGIAYYSPDGRNLAGGGSTERAYGGTYPIKEIVPVPGGVDAIFDMGYGRGAIYFSPDGRNLGGGGSTARIYSGLSTPETVVPVGDSGVVTLFAGGQAYFSPDNGNLGGGGNSIRAYYGTGRIARVIRVGGGVHAQFVGGAVYFSPDGKNLGGGGRTIRVPEWNQLPDGQFGIRDSAKGLIVNGNLWLSGGFGPSASTCTWTCSHFDLWLSMDKGASWVLSSRSSESGPRDAQEQPGDFYDAYSGLIHFNGQLWALGSTVWRAPSSPSTSGKTNWSKLSDAGPGLLMLAGAEEANAQSLASENTHALVLDDRVHYIDTRHGRAMSSNDPNLSAWTSPSTLPDDFVGRCGVAATAAQGKVWLAGGGRCYGSMYNDVLWSEDGRNWNNVDPPADGQLWSPRQWSCMTSDASGTLWLMGGYEVSYRNDTVPASLGSIGYHRNLGDLWYSKDGIAWKQLKADVDSGMLSETAATRHAPTCVVDHATNTLYVIAGKGGNHADNDLAVLQRTVRSLQLPAASSLP